MSYPSSRYLGQVLLTGTTSPNPFNPPSPSIFFFGLVDQTDIRPQPLTPFGRGPILKNRGGDKLLDRFQPATTRKKSREMIDILVNHKNCFELNRRFLVTRGRRSV